MNKYNTPQKEITNFLHRTLRVQIHTNLSTPHGCINQNEYLPPLVTLLGAVGYDLAWSSQNKP